MLGSQHGQKEKSPLLLSRHEDVRHLPTEEDALGVEEPKDGRELQLRRDLDTEGQPVRQRGASTHRIPAMSQTPAGALRQVLPTRALAHELAAHVTAEDAEAQSGAATCS